MEYSPLLFFPLSVLNSFLHQPQITFIGIIIIKTLPLEFCLDRFHKNPSGYKKDSFFSRHYLFYRNNKSGIAILMAKVREVWPECF